MLVSEGLGVCGAPMSDCVLLALWVTLSLCIAKHGRGLVCFSPHRAVCNSRVLQAPMAFLT